MFRNEKIKDVKDLASILGELKRKGKKIILSNGVFDLLHVGHIRHFEAARAVDIKKKYNLDYSADLN